MKNLFGFDRKAKNTNNDKLVLRDLDGASNAKLTEVMDRNLTAQKKSVLPLWLALPMPFLTCAGLILISLGIPDEAELFENKHLIMLIVGGILTALGLALFAVQYIRMKKLKQNPYYLQSVKEEEKLADEALKVPEASEKADVLIADKEAKNPVYRLAEMKIFKENENLCFSDGTAVTGVPLSQIMACYIIDKKTRFWTMEDLKKDKMTECGIRRSMLNANSSGTYVIPSRTALEIQLDGGLYEIVVPCYDSEKVLKYLNKNVAVI